MMATCEGIFSGGAITSSAIINLGGLALVSLRLALSESTDGTDRTDFKIKSKDHPPQVFVSSVDSKEVLDFLDFGVFAGAQLVNLFNVLVGELLQVRLAAFQVVLGDHLLFFKFAQVIVGGTANVSHRHPRFFQPVMNDFDQVLAALFSQWRDIQANDFAVVVWG